MSQKRCCLWKNIFRKMVIRYQPLIYPFDLPDCKKLVNCEQLLKWFVRSIVWVYTRHCTCTRVHSSLYSCQDVNTQFWSRIFIQQLLVRTSLRLNYYEKLTFSLVSASLLLRAQSRDQYSIGSQPVNIIPGITCKSTCWIQA